MNNTNNIVHKMKQLEVELEAEPSETESDNDSDICDAEEINKLFTNYPHVSTITVSPDKYILNISATLEQQPKIAISLSDNSCYVYSLSESGLAKLGTFSEHTETVSEVKFARDNTNLFYTCSFDGSVKLWDIRTPKTSAVQFEDTSFRENGKVRELSCFDISPNSRLLAAGSNLLEGDAFLVFFDLRKRSLLGAYWESHTDDITQVKFHSEDSNKLISGSVDGLINVYDLSQSNEDDALIDSLNTESSIEKLSWLQIDQKHVINCLTHTAEVQLWKLEGAQPYLHLYRSDIAKEMKRKSSDHIYVVNLHENLNSCFLLAGSNYHDGECLRGLTVLNNNVLTPACGFSKNKQRVRASCFNFNTNLLLTGGEMGILDAWNLSGMNSSETHFKKTANR